MASLTPIIYETDSEFSYTEGQTKYNEQLAWSLLRTADGMKDAGWQIAFSTASELSAMDITGGTFIAQLQAWLAACDAEIALADSENREPLLDNPPAIPDNPSEPLWLRVIKFAARIAIELFLQWLRDRKKHEKNRDVSEIVDWIQKAFLRKVTIGEEEVWLSFLGQIVDERNIKIDINDGQLVIWPGALSVDVSDDVIV